MSLKDSQRIYQTAALAFGVLVLCFALGAWIWAWTEPEQIPPQGNVPTPLHEGTIGQIKEGGLGLNFSGLSSSYGLIVKKGFLFVDEGNLGIGATSTKRLTVDGESYFGDTALIGGSMGRVGSRILDVEGGIKTDELCLGGDCNTSWPSGSPGSQALNCTTTKDFRAINPNTFYPWTVECPVGWEMTGGGLETNFDLSSTLINMTSFPCDNNRCWACGVYHQYGSSRNFTCRVRCCQLVAE